MKNIFRRGMALALAGTMCFSLLGCGGKKTDKDEAHFKQTYLDSVPAELSNNNGSAYQYKDKIYYQTSDEDGRNSTLNCFDIKSGENTVLFDVSALSSEDGYAYVNRMAADDDGNLLLIADIGEPKEGSGQGYENATEEDVIKFLVDEWDETEEEAKNSWTEYWAEEYTEEDGTVNYGKFLKEMNTEYDYNNELIKIDAEGNQLYEEAFEKASEDISVSVNAAVTDSKGNLYPLKSHQFRATFVRELIKQKVPIAHIMKQFSHVSIEMTSHYLTLQEEEVKEIYSDMILGKDSKIAGLRAKEIKAKLDEQFRGKTEQEIDDIVSNLSKSMSFNPLPTGVCLYDFRRGNCSDGDGCFFYNCPNYVTEVKFYPILKQELDLMEKEMARYKESGQQRSWERQYVKYKYLKPLVDSLEEQMNEEK